MLNADVLTAIVRCKELHAHSAPADISFPPTLQVPALLVPPRLPRYPPRVALLVAAIEAAQDEQDRWNENFTSGGITWHLARAGEFLRHELATRPVKLIEAHCIDAFGERLSAACLQAMRLVVAVAPRRITRFVLAPGRGGTERSSRWWQGYFAWRAIEVACGLSEVAPALMPVVLRAIGLYDAHFSPSGAEAENCVNDLARWLEELVYGRHYPLHSTRRMRAAAAAAGSAPMQAPPPVAAAAAAHAELDGADYPGPSAAMPARNPGSNRASASASSCAPSQAQRDICAVLAAAATTPGAMEAPAVPAFATNRLPGRGPPVRARRSRRVAAGACAAASPAPQYRPHMYALPPATAQPSSAMTARAAQQAAHAGGTAVALQQQQQQAPAAAPHAMPARSASTASGSTIRSSSGASLADSSSSGSDVAPPAPMYHPGVGGLGVARAAAVPPMTAEEAAAERERLKSREYAEGCAALAATVVAVRREVLSVMITRPLDDNLAALKTWLWRPEGRLVQQQCQAVGQEQQNAAKTECRTEAAAYAAATAVADDDLESMADDDMAQANAGNVQAAGRSGTETRAEQSSGRQHGFNGPAAKMQKQQRVHVTAAPSTK